MNSLRVRMLLVVGIAVIVSANAFSAPVQVNADEYKARLLNLANSSQAQVAALDEQVTAATDDAVKADLEHQIMDLKRQSEIQRLQILLEWAQAAGDETRAAEVQTALNNWLNPPQPQVMPQVDREIPAAKSTPSNNDAR